MARGTLRAGVADAASAAAASKAAERDEELMTTVDDPDACLAAVVAGAAKIAEFELIIPFKEKHVSICSDEKGCHPPRGGRTDCDCWSKPTALLGKLVIGCEVVGCKLQSILEVV